MFFSPIPFLQCKRVIGISLDIIVTKNTQAGIHFPVLSLAQGIYITNTQGIMHHENYNLR